MVKCPTESKNIEFLRVSPRPVFEVPIKCYKYDVDSAFFIKQEAHY